MDWTHIITGLVTGAVSFISGVWLIIRRDRREDEGWRIKQYRETIVDISAELESRTKRLTFFQERLAEAENRIGELRIDLEEKTITDMHKSAEITRLQKLLDERVSGNGTKGTP